MRTTTIEDGQLKLSGYMIWNAYLASGERKSNWKKRPENSLILIQAPVLIIWNKSWNNNSKYKHKGKGNVKAVIKRKKGNSETKTKGKWKENLIINSCKETRKSETRSKKGKTSTSSNVRKNFIERTFFLFTINYIHNIFHRKLNY